MKKMENLVEDNGICDCHYLLTMRLALQREVDSPFGINSIYDLGDWCAPWWRKPVSYADLDAFFESNGCGWLRQSIGIGSWRGDAGEDEKAARIIRASLEQHGLTLERARARYGKRRVSEARKWAETVAFFATGCSFLDIAEVVDRSVAQVSKEIYDTWCKDYYIGCVDNICKLAFDGYLVLIWCASRDLMKMGSNRARSSCLRSTWMARRRNCAALARPTYTACRGYGGYYVSTILAL